MCDKHSKLWEQFMSIPIKVLIVEDSEDDAQLLLRELKKGGYKPKHKRVETAATMKKALKENWDIILADYKMPNFSAPAALKVLQGTNLDIPFIIVSGSVGEDAAVAILKEGAHDFITKMNLSRLNPAIEREMQDWKVRQANIVAEQALQESEHRYKHLFQNHPSPMWVYDIATLKFVDVNDVAIKKYGYSREEFLSMTLFDIRPKKDYKRLKENLAKSRPVIQHSGEWTHLLKNGEIIFVEISSYLFEDNGKKMSLVVANDVTERRRFEEALKKSEMQYQTLARISPVGIFRTDAAGSTTYVNPRWCQISGLSADEALGDGWLKVVHKDDREKLSKGWKEALRKRKHSFSEYRFVRPDGTIAWVMGQAVPEKDIGNKIVGYVGTITDITDRKLIEETLKKSEENFRNLVENINDVFYVSDAQGKLLYCSPNFFTSTGFSVEEILGKTYLRLIAPVDRRKVADHYLGETKNGVLDTKLEFRVLRKNGTTIWVEQNTRIVRDNKGEVVQYRNVVRDVTERKHAEKLLKESELRFREVVEEATENIFTTDVNGYFTYANPAALKSSGYSLEELKKLRYSDLITDEYKRLVSIKFYKQYLNRTENTYSEYPFCTKSGEIRWFGQNARLIIENNEPKGFYLIARDVTERKRSEEALEESERKLSTLMGNLPGMAYRCMNDKDWTMTYVSDGCLELTGFKPEDLMNNNKLSFNDLIDENYREHLWNKWQEVLKNREVFQDEYTINTAEGKQKWVWEQGCGIYSETGEVIALEGLIIDITERKRAEESMLKLTKAVESSGEVIFMTDPNGIFTYINPEFTKRYGYESNEVIGKSTPRILKSGNMNKEDYETFWQTLLNNQVVKSEFINKSKDGKLINVEVAVNSVIDEKGTTIGFLAIQKDITERKETEKEISMFANALKSVNECVSITDMEDNLLFINESFEKTYGYNKDELVGKHLSVFRSPKTPPEITDKIMPSTLHGGWKGELWNVRKDGSEFPIHLSTKIINDKDGNPLGLIGVATDITERKKTEEELQKSREELLSFFEDDITADFISTPEGKIIQCNQTFLKLFGFKTKEEALTYPIENLYLNPAARKHVLELVRKNKKITYLETEFLSLTGEKISALMNIIGQFDVADELIQLRGYIFDITERKKAEDALHLQTTYFSQLFENSPTGIAFLDTNECVMNVNKAFENIFQYSLEEIKGKSLTSLIVPEELVKESLSFSTKAIQGELVRLSTVRKRRDGTCLDMIITGYPIIIEGKCVGIYAIYADVSDMRRLEEQVRQAQKLESIGTLAGGIAHDFNNILGIILGYTSLLGLDSEKPEKVKKSIDAISKAVQRGAGLVKQILTFARKTDIVFGAVNVNETVAELVKMLHETFPKTITLHQNLYENLPPIIGDHNQIHQAVLNLSVNARDAILSTTANGHGGSITFITKIILGAELRKKIPEAIDDAYVCLSVIDNGSGMDEFTRKRIFEPFFTTKEQGKGTGLGLSVVYGVVKSHHGFIDVQSQLGVGTTFYLYFPLEVKNEILEEVIQEDQPPIPGGTETILFVEDEEMLQEVVKDQLTIKGYRVLSAFDGEEAVEVYVKHQNEIALVLSDLGLPKLGGFEACLMMKKINPNAKIVLASGFFDPVQKSRMLEAGVEYFVQKPYRPNEILIAIRKLMDKK